MPLKDRIAFITGSSRGIGKGIAVAVAKAGAETIINCPKWETGIEETAEELKKIPAKIHIIKGDAGNAEEVEEMFGMIERQFSRLDILVNNVGVHKFGPTEDFTERDWDLQFNVNVKSSFLCSKRAFKIMKKQNYGRIINTSSKMGFVAAPNNAAYCSAKSAVIMLTQVLATEWAQYGIRVNSVAPGITKTIPTYEILKNNPGLEEKINKRTPMGRMAEPEEIGRAVVFLASDESSYVNGAVLPVDGGWLANGDYIG